MYRTKKCFMSVYRCNPAFLLFNFDLHFIFMCLLKFCYCKLGEWSSILSQLH